MAERSTERAPAVSVVIPTRNRSELLRRSVRSALDQTVEDLEVVVVDDGSDEAVHIAADPRVRVIRLPSSRGIAGALNAGVLEARGRWITHVDDDDRLLPHMVKVSLDALAAHEGADPSTPVAVVSGIEVVEEDGRVVTRRLPPTRHRGAHWSLEPIEPGYAYETRNTMVIERRLLVDVGLFDENLRSSVRNDLFLRLNPVCTIVGLPVVTYQHFAHDGIRVSEDHATKHASFVYLERKHRDLYERHPDRYAHYLRTDARRLRALGRSRAAVGRELHAARLRPRHTLAALVRRASRALRNRRLR